MNFEVRVIPVDSSVVLTLVAVVILYFGLKHFLYEPVSNFLSKRRENIEKDIEGAKTANEEAEVLRLEYEAKISEAREESQKILADARKRGEELKTEILTDAKKEAESIRVRAKEDIDREKSAAFESIRSETGEMALLIASKIMEKEMNVKNQDRLVDQFIDEVGNTPWQN